MNLWTWHTPDFDLLSGTVDPPRSKYYSGPRTPTIKPAYHRLWKMLGTSQFVWCYSKDKEHSPPDLTDEVEWRLSVPESEFLAILDAFAWNKILGLNCGAPPKLRHQWKSEAIAKYPFDAKLRSAYEEKQLAHFYSPTSPERLWESLFITDPTVEFANVLIRHPLSPNWVLGKKLHRARYPAVQP